MERVRAAYRLPAPDVVEQLLRAQVQRLHDCGLLHGDLACRNMSIDIRRGSPQVVLFDFGRGVDLKGHEGGDGVSAESARVLELRAEERRKLDRVVEDARARARVAIDRAAAR